MKREAPSFKAGCVTRYGIIMYQKYPSKITVVELKKKWCEEILFTDLCDNMKPWAKKFLRARTGVIEAFDKTDGTYLLFSADWGFYTCSEIMFEKTMEDKDLAQDILDKHAKNFDWWIRGLLSILSGDK